MEGQVLILENHTVSPVLGEDALDFNFEDEENSPTTLYINIKIMQKPEGESSKESMENLSKDITPIDTGPQIISNTRNRGVMAGETVVQMFMRKTGQGVPFSHKLVNPLRPNDLLLVEGTILKHGLRFTVNFVFGPTDIAFHLNPRLDLNYIARNTYFNGVWGKEEGFGLMKTPLQSGKNFQLMIFISPQAYLVCVNGYHMFSFSHRVPPETVEKIEIFGDIDLKTATLQTSDVYPFEKLIKYKKKHDTLHLPFTYMFKEPLKAGFKIEIKGKVKLLPVSFTVNLQSGEYVYPHPLVAYHLNVRYAPECYVVQNSWGFSGNNWDDEIRSPLPLSWSPGRDFEVNIYIYESYVHVKGDDWSIPVFKLRLNLDHVDCVYVNGDIVMTFFQITSFERQEFTETTSDILD